MSQSESETGAVELKPLPDKSKITPRSSFEDENNIIIIY
jgi:hypothetical protein